MNANAISADTARQIARRCADGDSMRTISSDLRVSLATVSRYAGYSTTKTTTPTSDTVKRAYQRLCVAYDAFERSPNRDNYNAHRDAIRAYEIARGKLDS